MTCRAILLLLAGYCFASFGWAMARHFRRLGNPTKTMLLTGALGILSAILQMVALGHCELRFPLLAFTLYGMSAILFWWAVGVSRRKLAACGQGAVSSEIITKGPYRYVRHPFYTAYNLAWIAAFGATLWWPLALSAIVMATLYERAAREEETGFAASVLAPEYEAYKGRAGKYLPRLNNARGRSGR